MSYRILYSRNDQISLEFKIWATGYPSYSFAEKIMKTLHERNKDFVFKIEKGTKEEGK